MKFKKSELSCLDWYVPFVTNKGEMTSKLQIVGSKEKNEVDLILNADVQILFTTFNKEVTEDFHYVYPMQEIVSLIKGIRDEDSEIEFIDNSISFNKSKYEFSVFDFYKSNIDEFKNQFNSKDYDFTFRGIEHFNNMKDFLGSEEDGCNVIVAYDNYLFATNKSPAFCFVNSENDSTDYNGFYFNGLVSKFLSSLKVDSISIKNDEERYFFKIGNTVFVISKGKSENKIPNFRDEKYKQFYDNPYVCSFDKNELKSALSRIKIVSSKNVNTRIFLSFKNNELLIESKDDGYAIERINASYDSELEDHFIILSTDWFSVIVNKIAGDTVKMYCTNSKNPAEAKTVKLTGETDNTIYLHTLYKYI